jgi:hypothetical protein
MRRRYREGCDELAPTASVPHPIFLSIRRTTIEKAQIPLHGIRHLLDIETIPAAAEIAERDLGKAGRP